MKLAVVAPAATLTEAGTVRTGDALLDNVTVVAVAGALERVTVHCVVVFCVSDEAVHCRAETVMYTRVTVADWLVPFRLADMWAVPDDVEAVLLAVKVALVALAATVTEARTVRLALSEDSVTVEADVSAALNVTVHVNEADGPIEFDPQETVLGVGRTAGLAVTVPAPPVMEIADPSAAGPIAVVTPIACEVTPAARVTETVATVPLAMVLELRPEARHA